MQKKRLWALVLAFSMAWSLTACSLPKLTLDPEELYALPELPERYTALNQQLGAILEGGAEYAAPVSGGNMQPVQMMDLDGDGREEALAFFRQSDAEKPLKIYVFTADGDGYRQAAVLEGSGLSIYSVVYNDLNGDGRLEIIVGWRVSMELQVLSVYALDPDGARELARSNYVKYAVSDLDGDGLRELTVFQADADGIGTADCYHWQENALSLCSTARVSMTMAELSQQGKVVAGTLRSGETALFVTGVADGTRTMTDVLLLRNGELCNLMLSALTGVSGEISRFHSLYPTDINGDGITEVPRVVTTYDEWDGAEMIQWVDWISFDAAGKEELALSTYHAMEDGWYLRLPEGWTKELNIARTASADEAAVVFYILNEENGTCDPVLRITALSGSNRERQAVRTGRFVLGRNNGVIYVGELLPANELWQHAATEDQIRGAFSLIATEWSAGDN